MSTDKEEEIDASFARMEVIMSSPVKECLGMENDIGSAAVKLTRAQKYNIRRKLKKKMKANEEDSENPKSKQEVRLNTISPSSLQNNPNTGLGTSAIVEQKMTESSPATDGIEKSSLLGIENDNGNGAVKLNKPQKKKRRKTIKRKLNANQEDTEKILVSKSEDHTKVANGEMGSSVTTSLSADVKVQSKMETAIGEMDSGTNTTGNTASKKRKRKRSRNKNRGSSEILSTHESTQDTVSAKNDSSATTSVNMKGMTEEQNKMETAITETGSGTNTADNTTSKKRKRKRLRNKNPSLSCILSTHQSSQDTVAAKADSSTTTNVDVKGMAEEQNKMETTIGETGSGTNAKDNTTKKKKKRKKLKNKNPGSSDILITHESTQDTVIANNDSSETTNINMKGVAEEQHKPKSKSGNPSLGDILNPPYLHNLEPSKGEMGSGTTATDNTSEKKRKRQKVKKTNPALGDILSTRESTKDTVFAKKESSTSNVLEAVIDQMVSQGEQHMKAAIGKTGSGEIKNLNVNDAEKMENKPKSKNKRPTLGEILNPQYLELKEAANGVEKTDSTIDGKSVVSIAEVKAKANISQAWIRNFWWQRKENQIMGIKEVFQAPTLGKKLIIFDVNGLLADIVSFRPKDAIADLYIPRKSIFKRPFLEDFLQFCFERFNVAIWSSRTRDNLDLAVDFLLGDLKKKLIFLWDATRCTNTGIRTVEDKYKCIVFKDLRKLWEEDADDSHWVKGTFNESNTLLLDDSPYKALLNPKHSGIFPTYSYKNRDDNSLGPEGELRTYLEGLAACDNVKTYVEQHPFGQGAINEKKPTLAPL